MTYHVPGTYAAGDRVITVDRSRQGTVTQDNRRDGGQYVWVEWDDEAPVITCSDPAEFRAAP